MNRRQDIPSCSPGLRWCAALTLVAIGAPPAAAHGGDECDDAGVLVRQAIALILNTPDDTMAIENKITDGGSASRRRGHRAASTAPESPRARRPSVSAPPTTPACTTGTPVARRHLHRLTRQREQRLASGTLAVQCLRL
jgi:hypothetical protein